MKRLLWGLSFLLLVSCSRLDIAVRWADDYLLHEVDSYLDLTGDQSKDYQQKLQQDIQRLKKENFPLMAAYLRRLAEHVEKRPLELKDIENYSSEGKKIFNQGMQQFKDTATYIISKTPDSRLERFNQKFAKKIEDQKKDIDSLQKQKKKSLKRYEKWFKEWLGGLRGPQEPALEAHLLAFPYPWDLQIKNRLILKDRILAVRKDNTSLKQILNNYDQERSPEFRQALEKYQMGLQKYLYELSQTLTPEQKKFLVERLRSRAKELENLSKS